MATRQPAPKSLMKARRARTPKKKRAPIPFRLSEPYEIALHVLAASVGAGASAFARRIVENYIDQHAPKLRTSTKRKARGPRG